MWIGVFLGSIAALVVWFIEILGYFFILRKIGLNKWACVIPFLAERELAKVLFRRLRTFYRPFVIALVLMIFGLYLGQSENLGFILMGIAAAVYGIFLIRLYWRLGKNFRRGVIFRICLLLAPPLFLLIEGLSRRQYQPLDLKPIKDHGRVGNNVRRAALVVISIAEILVLVFGVGIISVKKLPPQFLINHEQSKFYDKTKDLVSDGEVISREDAMGTAASAIADMEPSRALYFPDHSQDQSVAVLTYIVGSNLEHQAGLASANIRQMVDATGQGDNLTFVVQAGGSKRWFTKEIENNSVGRYEIKGGKLTQVEDLPDDTCMAEGENLTDFLNWAKQAYPADRYMLVLWDHGGGLPFGYGNDDLNKKPTKSDKDSGSMATSEVVDAIAKANMKFDVIGFDACLMQDIEVAAALEPYTDYYLASEETEGGYGWFYTSPFGDLAQKPGMSTQDFTVELLSCYDQMNTIVKDEDGEPDTKATLSLIDTTLAKPAYNKLADLFGSMDKAIREDVGAYASVAAAGTNAYAFANDMQIDLIDFLQILNKTDGGNDIATDEEMADLIQSLQASVLYRNKNSAEGIEGVAFSFPYKSLTTYSYTSPQLKALSMGKERKAMSDIFSIMAVQKKKAMENQDYKETMNNMVSTLTSGEDSGGVFGVLNDLMVEDVTQEEWYVKGFEDYDTTKALVDIPLEETENGYAIQLPEKTWKIITDVQTMAYLEMDGASKDVPADDAKAGQTGRKIYIGKDHIGGEDADGNPLVAMDGSWVRINGKVVCYEAEPVRETKDGDVYSGKVPARLNDKQDILLDIEWDPVKEGEEATSGHVTGYEPADSGILAGILETKGSLKLEAGDTLQFLFEVYDDEGNLLETKPAGDKIHVSKQNRLKVEDQPLEGVTVSYGGVLTDMYQRTMTTEMVEETFE